MGKTFEVPEGKLGTLFVNGVETELIPGKEYENAELVLTDKLDIPHSCELMEGKSCDYRAAVCVDKDGLNPASVVKAVSGGKFDGKKAEGVTITGTSPDFSGVIVNGGQYEIRDSRLSLVTESDGKKVCDFAGLGAAVGAFNGASVKIENSEIETVGVAKCSVFCDDGSDIVVKDSRISVMGGKVYDGYINNADFNYMVAPPWVLGIIGNARGTNLMGKKAATAIVNCDVKARNWGVLSTDNGDGMVLTVADCDLTLVGNDGEKKKNPYFKKYGSGYGTYILGTHEEFYGVTMNVGTYIGIARDGSAIYKSSRGPVKLVSPATGKTVYEGQGKGNISVLNSDGFGIMAHGLADITVTDETEMNTENAAFLLRCGGIKLNVSGKAKINVKDGVLLQIIDDDDSTVGVNWEGDMELQFNTEFNEKEGWPSENGQISSMMPPPPPPPMPPMPEGEEPDGGPEPPQFDVNFSASDVELKGDLYNGSGYWGQKAKQLYVTLGSGAVLTGAVSATETIHVDENGRQNTHFTQDEYYYLGHVANRPYFNGDNRVEVTLEKGSVWNVTGDGILTSLTVNGGAVLNGAVTVDGKPVEPEAGKTYKGDIRVSAK